MRSTTGGKWEVTIGSGGDDRRCAAQRLHPAAAALSRDEEVEGHTGLGWAISASWADAVKQDGLTKEFGLNAIWAA
jgi:hypothetical protein